MLAADHRLDAGLEAHAADQVMQENGDRRKDEWVILARHATAHIPRQIATDPLRFRSIVSNDTVSQEALYAHLRTQHIVEQPETIFEIDESRFASSLVVPGATFEEEPLDLLLALHRRKVGQRYVIGALVVPAFGFELRSALIVDQTRYRVREGSLLRVFVDFAANRIAMHQPSRAELQDRIQSLRKSGHLFVSGGAEIGTGITPGRHQCPILKEQDAIVDHRRIKQ